MFICCLATQAATILDPEKSQLSLLDTTIKTHGSNVTLELQTSQYENAKIQILHADRATLFEEGGQDTMAPEAQTTRCQQRKYSCSRRAKSA